MKPFKNIRIGKGYCCEYEDGPIHKWSKKQKRKRGDKEISRKEMRKAAEEVMKKHNRLLRRLKD